MAGRDYMAVQDRTGKTHLVERQSLVRGALELEAKGVPIASMRADVAAQRVLEHLLRKRGIKQPD